MSAGLAPFAAFLKANPLISAMAGIEAVSGIKDLLTTSPFERASQQGLAAQQRLLPQLEAQARGEPTAVTRAAGAQLHQQATRAGQSYAASAQRQGIGGGRTTPGRAQQGRLQAAEITAQGNILGQAQSTATQQLLGIGQQAMQGQQFSEARQDFLKRRLFGDIGDFMALYKENQGDDQWEWLLNFIKKSLGL